MGSRKLFRPEPALESADSYVLLCLQFHDRRFPYSEEDAYDIFQNYLSILKRKSLLPELWTSSGPVINSDGSHGAFVYLFDSSLEDEEEPEHFKNHHQIVCISWLSFKYSHFLHGDVNAYVLNSKKLRRRLLDLPVLPSKGVN